MTHENENARALLARIKYTVIPPRADRVHHINADDVRVVLGRLPTELWHHLRAVHFNDRSIGARRLGSANPSSREIAMCALPPRISLTRQLRAPQTHEQFGAIRGQKWPPVAVRRFLLYTVFLHELGHLQRLPGRRSERLSFPREKLAQQFAMKWRDWLWSQRFDHPDPAHNPPRFALVGGCGVSYAPVGALSGTAGPTGAHAGGFGGASPTLHDG